MHADAADFLHTHTHTDAASVVASTNAVFTPPLFAVLGAHSEGERERAPAAPSRETAECTNAAW